MIRELVDDLQSLTKDLNASTTLIAPNSVGINFKKLATYQKGIESELLALIDRELTEIDSLDESPNLPPRSTGVDISSFYWGLLSLLILLTISWS